MLVAQKPLLIYMNFLNRRLLLNIIMFPNTRDKYRSHIIELFIIKNAPKRPSYPEARGLRHLAFYVEDVEAMVTQLNQKGIKTEPIRIDDYTHKKMTFFFDPDGLPLEIHE